MEVWYPSRRNAFIEKAVNSVDPKGYDGSYQYKVYPKIEGCQQDDGDVRRAMLTDTLASVIYTKNPKFRYVSLGFYYNLVDKIRIHAKLGPMLWKDVNVVIKGANAYAYLTKDPTMFPFSDLDIMVMINPELSDGVFADVKAELRTIVLQLISQYKRMLDNMFFVNGSNKYKDSDTYKKSVLLSDELIEEFKKEYKDAVMAFNMSHMNENVLILSPFEDDSIRNGCSRYSFVMANSKRKPDSVVRVEVPHYDKCEKIPLKKSPFFASYNETIDFKRDGASLAGKFDLYRIKFCNLIVELDDEGNTSKEDRVAADFIDVSIAEKGDAELTDFYGKARCEQIKDPEASVWRVYRDGEWVDVNCWLVVPNVATCVDDLHKMLNVYGCPESKKAKREARYKALKAMMTA